MWLLLVHRPNPERLRRTGRLRAAGAERGVCEQQEGRGRDRRAVRVCAPTCCKQLEYSASRSCVRQVSAVRKTLERKWITSWSSGTDQMISEGYKVQRNPKKVCSRSLCVSVNASACSWGAHLCLQVQSGLSWLIFFYVYFLSTLKLRTFLRAQGNGSP